jgi:hypothetical protein
MSREDDLRKRAQSAPDPKVTASDAWKPWQDDRQPSTLVGTLRDEHATKAGRVAEIEDEHGQTWTVWLDPVVLQRQWREDRPQVGELIAIDYRGQFEGRNGNSGALNLVLVIEGRADDTWGGFE